MTRERAAGIGPLVVLAAVICLAAGAYSVLAQRVRMPMVNPDELIYTLAARSVADGGWLSLRGAEYGYGAIYPLVLAPVAAVSGPETAYALAKVVNAVLFALAAVPAYALARRLLSPWWSVGVAALAVLIPSSIYTGLVMTESTAYLAAGVAFLAVTLALERPSVVRQAAMLAVIAAAYLTRPQFLVLAPAFLVGALLLWALDAGRPRLRTLAARLWPTLATVGVLGGLAAARIALSSQTPQETLGGYGALWRGYDPISVARFVLYHAAGWEIYLFVVPFVVTPIVVAELLRAARRGARREGAFVVMFLIVNAAVFLIAAAFASTPYGYRELHDRFVFYVAPLWLVVFAVWLSRGLPRPVPWTALGVGLALVLPAVVPVGLISGNIAFEFVPTALWGWVWDTVEGTPHLDGRRVLGLVVVALTALAAALPRRLWPVLPAVVATGFVVGSVLAWHRLTDAPYAFVAADTAPRTWVDDALPAGSRVTKLYTSPESCPYTELVRHAFVLTELFNPAVDHGATIGDSSSDGLPRDRVHVGIDGQLVRTDGAPLMAAYVVTQPEIVLRGRRVAEGTGAKLVLWQTGGRVQLADARERAEDLVPSECG